MANHPMWYDPETDPSPLRAALWRARHLCTRAEAVSYRAGSYAVVSALMKAIDDYAEVETGNREYFWSRPHSIG